jgi:replicative DNA helicase
MEDKTRHDDAPPLLGQELDLHLADLRRWQGGEMVGLAQGSLTRLDRATLGLRGLMLLAGAPNEGKTALAMQLGLDVVRMNPDACFLFLSLEMSRKDMMTRLICNLARVDWKMLVLGEKAGLTAEHTEALAQAQEELKDLGQRILILDEENFPRAGVDQALRQLEGLQRRSGCSRAFILVDYLQVWPLPPTDDPAWSADPQADPDMWRVGQLKALRDRSGQAVMTISEVRRPPDGRPWASALADVAGSSRAIYSPDMVFLLQTLGEEEALRLIGGDPRAARQQMREMGLVFNRLSIAKGRDGVMRESLNLTFFYRQARFAEGFKVFA